MPSQPRVVSVSDLKAHALELVAKVSATGGAFVITKRGKPVARLVPFRQVGKAVPGRLRHALVGMGDVVSPTGADWESAR
jgi:prevent-host-death family protein